MAVLQMGTLGSNGEPIFTQYTGDNEIYVSTHLFSEFDLAVEDFNDVIGPRTTLSLFEDWKSPYAKLTHVILWCRRKLLIYKVNDCRFKALLTALEGFCKNYALSTRPTPEPKQCP